MRKENQVSFREFVRSVPQGAMDLAELFCIGLLLTWNAAVEIPHELRKRPRY